MLEGLRQAGERGQIQDSQGVNFSILNAPYRLLSGREVRNTRFEFGITNRATGLEFLRIERALSTFVGGEVVFIKSIRDGIG
jgi:hypothetical protein